MKIRILLLLLFAIVFACEAQINEVSKNIEKKAGKLSLEILKYVPNEELGYCRKSTFKIKQNSQYIDSITFEMPYDCCDTDNGFTDFNNSIKVNDLNNDNYNEISFVYREECVSDVSPFQLRAILYNTQSKMWHTIYGSTTSELLIESVKWSNAKYGSKINIDTIGSIREISKDIPIPFLNFLKKEWYTYSHNDKIPQNKAENKAEITYLVEKSKTSKKTLVNYLSKVKFTSPNIELILSDNSVLKFSEPVFFVDDVKFSFYNNIIALKHWNPLSRTRIESFWHFDEKKKTLILNRIFGCFSLKSGSKTCSLKNLNLDIKSIDGNKLIELLKMEENCRD